MVVRRSTEWSTSQREFHERYVIDSDGLPRRPVHYRVVSGGRIPMGSRQTLDALWWAVSRLRRKRMFNEDAVIAVWAADAATGSEAALIVEFDNAPPKVEGEAILVGEFMPNGTLCLEAGVASLVWPTYNPRRPTR